MAKTKISRTFTATAKKNIFTKSVQNYFPRFSVQFQIFQKLSENSSRISRTMTTQKFLSKAFSRKFLNLFLFIFIYKIKNKFPKISRILKQFWSTCVFRFVQQLNPSGRMALSCQMISQSNCEKAGQGEQLCNNNPNNIEDLSVFYTSLPGKLPLRVFAGRSIIFFSFLLYENNGYRTRITKLH